VGRDSERLAACANLQKKRTERNQVRIIMNRLVATLAVAVVLSAFVPSITFAQQLQSGALLTIQSTDGSLNLAVYDGQIHSGVVRVSPCDGALITDAYVLQGGSPTGCDNGDSFETGQAPGNFELAGTGYQFDITTFYQFGGCNSPGNSGPIEPICASPDTGFLTVTNNGSSAFTGMITLSGQSTVAGGYCAPGGASSDSYTGTLGAGQSRTFALSTDSSNCGGFTGSQTQTLIAGGTAKFPLGSDYYQVAAIGNSGGEQLALLPVPVLQSSSNPGSNGSNTFNPGSNFPTFSCSPYGSFSEAGNPECVEFQLTCSGAADCEQFLYMVTSFYNFPPGFGGIGGPGFLKASGQKCATSLFDKNILSFYSADTTHTGGGGGLSCFVAAFTPGAPIVNSFSPFVGFQTPVSDTKLNVIQAGSAVPLIWQQFAGPNTPLTNLTYCSSSSPAPGTCTAPWVNLATVPADCSTGQVTSDIETGINWAGNSGLQNLGQGNYQVNWKTVKGSKGCVKVVVTFDSGLTLLPALFEYK
jgi:hypothetical protein